MKMLLIIGPKSRDAELRELFARQEVHAYTEMREVVGEGQHGKRLGTDVWPGVETLFFSVVPEEKLLALSAELKIFAKKLFPAEGLKAFVLPAEPLL